MAAKFIRLFTTRLALTIFIAVWIIGLGTEIWPTFFVVANNIYTGTSRIQLPAENRDEVKFVQSPELVKRMSENMGVRDPGAGCPVIFLAVDWENLINAYQPWQIRPVKNSSPPQTDIICISGTADDAALIANKVANTFRDLERQKQIDVQIVERASPAIIPLKIGPLAKACTLAYNLVIAGLLATLYGTVAAILAVLLKCQMRAPRTYNSPITP